MKSALLFSSIFNKQDPRIKVYVCNIKDIPKHIPNNIPKSIPMNILQNIPKNIPKSIPESIPKNIPKNPPPSASAPSLGFGPRPAPC